MNDAQLKQLKAACNQVRSSKKPFLFVYLEKGADRKPFLVIQRKLSRAEALKIRQAEGATKMLYGRVSRSMAFTPEREPPARFVKDLKVMGTTIPRLKKATVVPPSAAVETAPVLVDRAELEALSLIHI